MKASCVLLPCTMRCVLWKIGRPHSHLTNPIEYPPTLLSFFLLLASSCQHPLSSHLLSLSLFFAVFLLIHTPCLSSSLLLSLLLLSLLSSHFLSRAHPHSLSPIQLKTTTDDQRELTEVVQEPFPILDKEGVCWTLGDLMQYLFGERYVADRSRVLIHGISPPSDTPLQWLARHLCHADNFCHLVVEL